MNGIVAARRAKQDRSRKSAKRLVDAADELASELGFEGMSIRQLCDRAGLSTGAFYARFTKKTDLALILVERLALEFKDIADSFSGQCKPLTLESSLRSLLENVIQLYRRRSGLLRALIAVAQTHSDVARAMRQANEQLFAVLFDAIEQHRASFKHPKPELGIRLGLLCVFNALRELVLEQQLMKEKYAFRDSELVDEFSSMLLKYLEVEND